MRCVLLFTPPLYSVLAPQTNINRMDKEVLHRFKFNLSVGLCSSNLCFRLVCGKVSIKPFRNRFCYSFLYIETPFRLFSLSF